MLRIGLLFAVIICGHHLFAQNFESSKFDYTKADSIAAIYNGDDIDNLPLLAFNLTNHLSEEHEKFRSIYTWVCQNIENDYGYYLLNKRKREKLISKPGELEVWNDEFRVKVLKRLQKDKITVCTGYAYLVSELAKLADIDCRVINGFGRTVGANIGGEGIPNHSWNAVKLNGNWYLCDATWSSGSINPQKKEFIKEYNDGYFLADPDLFAKSHFPLDSTWLLTDNYLTLESFLNGPLVYKNAFSYKIKPVNPSRFENSCEKGEKFSVSIKWESNKKLDDLSIELVRGSKIISVTPVISDHGNDNFTLSVPLKSKGKYDFHLKAGKDYIVTWVVDVI
ncbi:transglutaminase domain-containing protein [Marinigracilibium pacificum]|uniref:Transglutaminase-like domain-containing protein n=1 Tax=Marinigracilibium pacificum TaxID=2729599 RepID=A0A848J5W5_9BACT|nr:transglutaminase domain-containing protein [Marinigracilibium pacificum]NMM49910.1 hypothetical protein [Marinigracilibium pacificum]